jgi:hypothetical protein
MDSEQTTTLLATDPSVRSLGYAVCRLPSRGDTANVYDRGLWLSGVIQPQGLDLQSKWVDAYEQLAACLRKADTWPTHLVAEWPQFFPSVKGRTAACQDYTIGLAGMAAGIVGWFRLPASRVTLWTPTQWKGSMPKAVTRKRVEMVFQSDLRALGDDEIDALGLAVCWLKRYLRASDGPPLDERHSQAKADLIRLVSEARAQSGGSDSAWWSRISTVLRRRRDIPRGLAREVLRSEFKIRSKQIETILSHA